MTRTKSIYLALLAALLSPMAANADVIFDNFDGTDAERYFEETRSATNTFGTVLNTLTTTTIDDILVRWRPNNDMDVTLGIWNSQLAGSFGSLDWSPIGNNLLYSQTISVLGDPLGSLGYLEFTGVGFTFEAGKRYDLGIWGSTGSLLGSWDIVNGCGNVNTTQNGFESINKNANISPGSSDRGYACVDPHIQLVQSARVPEPGTLALLGLGLVCMAARRRRTV